MAKLTLPQLERHLFAVLAQDGLGATVMPHVVLFREGEEWSRR